MLSSEAGLLRTTLASFVVVVVDDDFWFGGVPTIAAQGLLMPLCSGIIDGAQDAGD